jgi:aspartate/methionine/tyrosine aminotransferase
MADIPFSGIRKVFEEAARHEARGEIVIHLEVGRPDFDTPGHIKQAAQQALSDGQVHYTSNYGLVELRRAIAAKLVADNGLSYDPNSEVLVTVGVTEAISLSMLALLDPGDEVLIPGPGFICYQNAARLAGAIPVTVPLSEENGFVPDASQWAKWVTPRTRMLVLNSPHNPTGAVFPRRALEEIAALCQANDLIVLSDEMYEKIIYDGREHVSIASLPGMQMRSLVLNGFSKAYAMTGWRLGYIAAPGALIDALVRVHQYMAVCATTFAQWGGVAALSGDQQCVANMVEAFDRRRKMLMEKLDGMEGISYVRPAGCFYVFINVARLRLPPVELAGYLLKEARIAVVPWGAQHVRISYANSYENLTEAMENMAQALGRL